jgi:S-DNA-T family DNA segregation ATPase FtsK/SpoIIIE
VGLVEGTQKAFWAIGRLFTAIGRFLVSLFSWEPLEEEETEVNNNEDESVAAEKSAEDRDPKKYALRSATEQTPPEHDTVPMESGASPAPKKVRASKPAAPATAEPATGTPAAGAPVQTDGGVSPPNASKKAADVPVKVAAGPTSVPHAPSTDQAADAARPSAVAEEAPAADGDILIPAGTTVLPLGGPRIIELETPSTPTLHPVSTFTDEWGQFRLPDPELLHYEPQKMVLRDREHMLSLAARLEQAFLDYKIKGSVQEIHVGPVITMYEFVPEAGIRVSRIESLAKDLALSLAATRVRIVAPIPGKSAVGIEVPNEAPQMVFLKEIVADPAFAQSKSKLTMAMGKDIKGRAVVFDLAKAPHLLIAGTTGSGKSVGVNAMILSILFRASPRDVRMILIDPKMVEFSIYNDIPHLLLPVVTDPQQANLALQWAVREMERRYQMLSDMSVRDLGDYNQKVEDIRKQGIVDVPEHLPFIFERFYRADPSRTRETGGSGIGLAIAMAIAKAHGGEIRVNSTVGQGSEFELSLPNAVSSTSGSSFKCY